MDEDSSPKETIIRWDSQDRIVTVYSCHRRMWTKLAKAGWHLVGCSKSRSGADAARIYEAPLNQFSPVFRTREVSARLHSMPGHDTQTMKLVRFGLRASRP